MIAYKWTIKKDNKYYSLINFDIYSAIKIIFCPPYELNKVYSNYIKNLTPEIRQRQFNIAGFHFWKEPKINPFWDRYNHCLKQQNNPEINAILKCEIDKKDIIIEDKERVVAKQFKVLEEIK